jgi:endonuclease-8
MPEGDTLWRIARSLDAVLAGQTLTGFDSVRIAVAAAAEKLRLVGRTIERVESKGKHLLVHFSGGPVLHTHLGMRGSWRLAPARREPPGAGAGTRPWPALVVLHTARAIATCRNAPTVELLARGSVAHPALSRLGPDLLSTDFDASAARRRLRARGELPIGVAVMDQTCLAGIGNVYKSEVLFACSVSPLARVSQLDDATLDRLVAAARQMLRRNRGPGLRRTTTPLAAERHAVYRRSGQPCPKCGATIQRIVQGERVRSTYFCPVCQPAPRPLQSHATERLKVSGRRFQ